MRAKKSTVLLTQAIQHTYGIHPVAIAPVIDWNAIRPRGMFEWDFEGDSMRASARTVFDIEANMLPPNKRLNVGTVVAHVPDADGYYTFPVGQFGAPSRSGIRYAPGAFEVLVKNLPLVTPHHTIKSMRAGKNGSVIGEMLFHGNPDNQSFMRTLINSTDDSAFSARYGQYMHNAIVDAHRDDVPVDESFSMGIRGLLQDGELLGSATYNLLPPKVPAFSYREWTPVFPETVLEIMRDAAGLPARSDIATASQREAALIMVNEGMGTYDECLELVRQGMKPNDV